MEFEHSASVFRLDRDRRVCGFPWSPSSAGGKEPECGLSDPHVRWMVLRTNQHAPKVHPEFVYDQYHRHLERGFNLSLYAPECEPSSRARAAGSGLLYVGKK